MKAGLHFLSSSSQLSMTEVGTIMRCGPQLPFSHARWARRAIVWIVLPVRFIVYVHVHVAIASSVQCFYLLHVQVSTINNYETVEVNCMYCSY